MHDHMYDENTNEIGKVIRLVDDQAIIELETSDKCNSCGAKVICIPNKDGRRIINAQNSIHAKIGNKVIISKNDRLLLNISVLQYGIPLLGFITGIFGIKALNVGIMSFPDELIQFIGGILGLIISGMLTKYLLSKLTEKKVYNNIFKIKKIFP